MEQCARGVDVGDLDVGWAYCSITNVSWRNITGAVDATSLVGCIYNFGSRVSQSLGQSTTYDFKELAVGFWDGGNRVGRIQSFPCIRGTIYFGG